MHYFQRRFPGQVIGIRQEDNTRVSGPGIVACNAEDPVGLRRLFDKYSFASVLNSAGTCALKSCELDSRLAWRTNVEGLINLLAIAVERQMRLVHLSVDLVFPGELGGGYIESDPIRPLTVYGKTMASAEQLLVDWMPEACILRISLPMGVSSNGHAGAIDWIQSRFTKSKPATLFYDEIRTPTYTDCLNEVYAATLASDLAGVYHAGSAQRLSLYQIGQVINRVGGYDPELLMGCWRSEAGPMPPRAGDVSMDSSRLAQALGYEPFDPWPHDPRFLPTHRRWHFSRPGTPGSPRLLREVLYRNPARAEV
jgi:dTDP-4-dehydrorhamnose reductase